MELTITSTAAMEELGGQLAQACNSNADAAPIIYLQGDLGVGKTTLVRGLLQRLGHRAAVKSPTYTLVESYELAGRIIYHFDLYRINNTDELEYMGLRDYFSDANLCLIEWPERGAGLLPRPDLQLDIRYATAGRQVVLHASTRLGEGLLAGLPRQPII